MTLEEEQVNETDVTRHIRHENGKTYIESEVDQKVDHETFMEMFSQKLTEHQQLSRKIRDMGNEIEQLLEEKDADLQLLHAIDKDQDQSQLPEKVQRGTAVDSVPTDSINSYVNLVNAQNQREQEQNKLDDVKEDLEELGRAAEQLAEEHEELELPAIWTEKLKYEIFDIEKPEPEEEEDDN